MSSIWDSLGGTAKIFLGPYTHIKELFQALPSSNNSEQKAIGDKLNNAFLTDGGFALKLNKGLESKETRERIARLYQEDPAALNRAMDRITAHAENTAAIVKSIPLKSEQVTQRPAPENGPPPGGSARPSPLPPEKTPDQPATTPGRVGSPDNADRFVKDIAMSTERANVLGGADEVRKMQAQLYLMGYKGDQAGRAVDCDAMMDFAVKHNMLPAGQYGGVADRNEDFIKRFKETLQKDWDTWTNNKDNAKHVSDVINAGYNVGTKQPPSDVVKEMQTALLAMGGPLPRFGADGVRGHETNSALRGLMAPGGAFTRMLDAVGIPHEWPSAAPPAKEKPDGTPKVTKTSVLTGSPSGMASYFTSQSRQDSGQGNGVLPESQRGLSHPVTHPKLQP